MSTTVFLVRHAAHDHPPDVLLGRRSRARLSPAGHESAREVATRLKRAEPRAIYTSPQQRARETAEHLSDVIGPSPVISPRLDEVDYGDWTGRGIDSLANDHRWTLWNAARSLSRPPGGEAMTEVQTRIVAFLREVAALHPDGHVVAVSHADVIRSALLYCIGSSLDAIDQFSVALASVHVITSDGRDIRLVPDLLSELAA